MNIQLRAAEYAQVGTTAPGCMVVVNERAGGKELDRIVVGSQTGYVICINRKGQQTQIVFKTAPGHPVSRICLGGLAGKIKDKVFVAAGATVRGISKKGKVFFSVETNLSEPVRCINVWNVDLMLASRTTFTQFHDGIESGQWVSRDDILDVCSLPLVEGSWVGRGLTVVVACADSSLKVISAGAKIEYSVPLPDVPNTLALFMNDGGYTKQMVVWGGRAGLVGLVSLPPDSGKIVWQIETRTAAAVTALCFYPICGTGTPDLIVGKHDGSLEIYNIDDQDKASFRQSHDCDESITAVGGGRVSSADFDEIIICTYTADGVLAVI